MPLLNRFYACLLVIASFVSIDQYAKHTKYQLKNRTSQATELERIDQNRLASYSTVANKLACLSDVQLAELLSKVPEWSVGCGKTGSIDIDGVPVFIKKIALTDLEKQPENMYSTANLFDLPLFYQYRVGSDGFGVWRELAAQIMTSNWVLTNACNNFPLLYHWRIVKNDYVDVSINQENIDKDVEYWDGSLAIQRRLESIHQASTSVVMFLESIPQTLDNYLAKEAAQDSDRFDSAVRMIDKSLAETILFMNDHGMIHFDAHGYNIMTDGYRLYFADFGLTNSLQFDLSDKERAFFKEHENYDKISALGMFACDILKALSFSREDRMAQLERYAAGDNKIIYSPYITSILQKYALSAIIYDSFIMTLRNESKLTPYPSQEIARICAKLEE